MTEVLRHRAGPLRAFGDAYLLHRYAILFYTLLLTLVAAPVFAAFELAGALFELFLAASLLVAVLPLSAGRGRRVLLTAAVVAWLARPATAWFGSSEVSTLTLALWILIGMFAAAGAVRFAIRSTSVDLEHLYAALSAYLLAGIFFGLLYWVIEQVWPATFTAGAPFSRMSGIYFSFVTLATLGYGDIVPHSDAARGLAILEGVGGQLFLAVLVARLVSLYTKQAGS